MGGRKTAQTWTAATCLALTGDWGGARSDLSKKGMTFDASMTQIGQGVGLFGRFGASGGNPNPMQYFYSAGVGGAWRPAAVDPVRVG